MVSSDESNVKRLNEEHLPDRLTAELGVADDVPPTRRYYRGTTTDGKWPTRYSAAYVAERVQNTAASARCTASVLRESGLKSAAERMDAMAAELEGMQLVVIEGGSAD